MRSRHWRLRAAVTGAAVLALVAATGPTGSAAPPPTGSTLSDSAIRTDPAKLANTDEVEQALPTTDTTLDGGTKVTLITGDVVTYQPGTNGAQPRVQVSSPRSASFTQVQDGDHFYVYPADARPLVGAGKLDKMLFDVVYLANNGYADDRTQQLPVIVQYPKPAGTAGGSTSGRSTADAKVLASRVDALPATTDPAALPAVGSAAVQVAKADAAKFWSSVDAPKPGTASLDAGVAKIWLDGRITASLDVSVPQIGAPEAWAAGYDGKGVKVAVLDTGIDDTHPDLAGKITDSKSFIDGESVKDGHGHGTHVASTIVGSGAASGGKYKGVAPGADLIVGKVLGNSGSGTASSAIEGMTWAAQSGARIVSMSFGGCCSDGTDPMAQAVNDLTAQYGTLFVVAAGNDGPGAGTIYSPGAADTALTVAAVDKQDQMASFSSRGPRINNNGLKPDIAAPGVDITAAKADGTALGPVVDDKYTTISGTSMATPHVAGSAAILAQEHPDWTGAKLKQVLISTSKDVGHGTYEHGAGRVDIPRATTQQVYATSNVDFGIAAYPHTAPVDRPLTYVNDGDTPVTLTLTTSVAAINADAPAGILTVSPSTLAVPAHGTAEATVTFDVTQGPEATYGGAVHATGDGITVNTAVGGTKQPRQSQVSMKVINRPGATDVVYTGFIVKRLDDRPRQAFTGITEASPSTTASLDVGNYSVGTDVTWRDSDGEWNRAMVTDPDVDATGDTASVTFDLRRAKQEVVRTPKPAVPFKQVYGYRYITEGAQSVLLNYFDLPYGSTRLWSLSIDTSRRGSLTGFSTFYNGVDPVKMSIRGPGHSRTALHPLYQSVLRTEFPPRNSVTMLDGRSSLPVVAAGHGLPADFQGVKATGKIALLDLSDICPVDPVNQWGLPCYGDATDRIQNAKDAGAVAVLVYGTIGRQLLISLTQFTAYGTWPTYPIPVMNLTADEGRMLAAKLARGPVTIDVDATKYSPYLYPLTWVTKGRMPVGTKTVTDRDLVRTDHRMHTDTPGSTATVAYQPVLKDGMLLEDYGTTRPAPFTVTTYAGPVGRDVVWFNQGAGPAYSQTRAAVVTRAGSETQNWGEQPLVPSGYMGDPATAPYTVQFCYSCRSGNVFSTQHVLTNNGRQGGFISYSRDPFTGKATTDVHLYRADGTEIPKKEATWLYLFSSFASPYFELPPERASYRMTESFETPRAGQRYARTVQTERTFTSQRPDDGLIRGPVGNLGVQCSSWLLLTTDSDNKVHLVDQNPCRPSDELYLGYDFGLNLDNTLPADSTQSVTVTGFRTSYNTTQPKLTAVTLSLSYDDGATWQPVRTKANSDGTYTGTFTHPALSETSGAVSVRAEATDSDGNTVSQTISRAYGLTAATGSSTSHLASRGAATI